MWTSHSYDGVNLYQIASHELGHTFGLGHSPVVGSLMNPFYQYKSALQLHFDDINGIQSLYGEVTLGDEYLLAETNNKEMCTVPKIDTIFIDIDGHAIVFKGRRYWQLTDTGFTAGYPKFISGTWNGLPRDIDAAFTYNNKTYFFKGAQYWKYFGNEIESGYPKLISREIFGIPNDIDAIWNRNGTIYFFKGDSYWALHPNKSVKVPKSYPRKISRINGAPDNLDAAITYNQGTYFFKNDMFYKINATTFTVEDKETYPLSTTQFFGCPGADPYFKKARSKATIHHQTTALIATLVLSLLIKILEI